MAPERIRSGWDRVIGQPDAVATLRAAAADPAAMTHSWLITGPAGSGRSVAALAFAAALECARGTGCGECEGCHLVLARSHPDVQLVAPEGLSLGVDATRGLVRDATAAPVLSGHRVLIIEDADRLTEQAANVLLKPLEEPGGRTVFVLCAPSVEDLLPTIRSRCRVLRLRLPAPGAVAEALRAEGVDAAMAAFAAAAAQGHIGRARWLAREESARRRRAEVLALPGRLGTVSAALAAAADVVEASAEEAVAATSGRNAAELEALASVWGLAPSGRGAAGGGRRPAPRGSAGAVKELEREQKARGSRTQRDVLDRALLDLAALYRDVLCHQLGALVEPVHADQGSAVQALARSGRPARTVRCIEAVLACREAISANVAPLLAVESMALALRDP